MGVVACTSAVALDMRWKLEMLWNNALEDTLLHLEYLGLAYDAENTVQG
jgi:hypothetical protein